MTVKLLPKELHHTDRCVSNRVHDKVRAATLRDLLKSARLCFPILARLIVLSQHSRSILEEASMDAMASAPIDPQTIPSTALLKAVAEPGGTYDAPRTPGLTFPGAGLDEPFLAALGRKDTADVLRNLRDLRPAFEKVFRLAVVGVDDSGVIDGDSEVRDLANDQAEQIAFDKALAEALEEAQSDDLINSHEKP